MDNGEERWQTIGMSEGYLLLMVAHTWRDEDGEIESVRIDADVLAWFKSQGKGYQTRINNILREVMLRSL